MEPFQCPQSLKYTEEWVWIMPKQIIQPRYEFFGMTYVKKQGSTDTVQQLTT